MYQTTDQLGEGVYVYVGMTDSPLCPSGAGLAYMAAYHFKFTNGQPLTTSKFTKNMECSAASGSPI